MAWFGPNPAALPQTSLSFRLFGLFSILSRGNRIIGIRARQHLDTLIWTEERNGIYIFLWHQNLAQRQQKNSCLFQWDLSQTPRMDLIKLVISCLKPGQFKSKLDSWSPSMKAAAKLGPSGTVFLNTYHQLGWQSLPSPLATERGYLRLST